MLKKIVGILSVVILVMLSVGCGKPKPEDTIDTFFDCAKKFDFEQMEYTIEPSQRGDIDGIFMGMEELEYEKALLDYAKSKAEKIKYTIKDKKVDKNEAMITLKCKFVNSENIVKTAGADAISIVMKEAVKGNVMKDDEIDKLLADTLKEKAKLNEDEFIEKTVRIKCVKTDGEWYIYKTEAEVLDVILCNYSTTMEEMKEVLIK